MAGSSGVAAAGNSIFDREAARYDAWFDSPDGRLLSRRRSIRVVLARGEALPFPDGLFGAVLLIVTLCFADPQSLLAEAKRVLFPPAA